MPATIELRKFPYPYRAALSICSDIDHTHPAEKFLDVQEFMGKRIGIAFGNTFFPYHEGDEFSWFSSRPRDREVILEHLKNGQIEALHGFGEKQDFSREDARKALEALRENGVRLKMWIDHADFPGNLCKYRCSGKGDLPGQKAYHLDLTADYGVKYIWTDRLTNIIGQGVPVTLASWLRILDFRHPVASGLMAAKTAAKMVLGFYKSRKYAFITANEPAYVATLGDGRKMFEFVRFNNYFQGAAVGDSFSELYYMISSKVLKCLAAREAYAIVYVHLGKHFDPAEARNARTVQALHELKQRSDRGEIWVDTPLRQLEYYVRSKYLKWEYTMEPGAVCITIHSVEDPVSGTYVPAPEDLQGMAFYVPDGVQTSLRIGAKACRLAANPPDHAGRPSISIR